MEGSEGVDVPLIRLRPLRERKVSKRDFNRILGSIKAVGLIEPLVVYPEGDDYVILDGVQRYRGLLELGVEVAPCILGPQREAFTGNRMVNRVSPVQEHRMIEKTPPHQRDTGRRKNNPWDRSAQRKNDLLKQLADAEQKHDFYSRLYKQYTIDLLRMAIYVRTLINNTRVREYLQARHPAVVAQFEAIIADARG